MSKLDCPHCHSPAVRVSLIDGYKFYCSRCGWNHEIVRRELSSTVKSSSVLLVLGVVSAIVVGIKNHGEGWTWAILLAFSGLPVYYGLSAVLETRKLRTMSFQPAVDRSRAVSISEVSSSGDLSDTILFENREFPDLVAVPPPRKLRMTSKGRFYTVFALAAVSLLTVYGLPAFWTEFNNPHSLSGRNWLLVIVPIVVYGYSFVFFRNRIRERQLLANGELASGHVTAQFNGEYTHSVQYCFKTSADRLVFGRCNDASRSLYEGMTVPVFYDPDNPTRSIPLDCSMTRINSSR
jgi:hypothetical protein